MTQAELFNKLYGGARWDVGVSINRSNSLPLDANSIFASYELAAAYASRDASRIAQACAAAGIDAFLNNAYIGQILAVITNDNVSIYYIDNNLALQEVGSKVVSDDRTVELNANDELGLHDFGVGYYAYDENAGEGQDPYVWTEGFIAGLEPKAKLNAETGKYELAWYQPNPTTVEGLSSEINTLKQTVSTMETSVAKIPTLEAGLADRYTKEEVDAKIAGVLIYKGVATAVSTTTNQNDTITVNGVNIFAAADNIGHVYMIDGKEYASNGAKWEELGSTTDLTNYYTKTQVDDAIDADVAALKATLDAVDSGLTDRVTAIETNYARKTEVEAVSGTVATLSEKVNGEAGELDALQGTVSTLSGKVDGEAAKLATLTTTVEGHGTTLETLETELGKKLATATYEAYIQDKAMSDTELKEYADGLVTTLNSDVATLKTNVSTLQTDVGNLKTTVGDVNSGLVKNVAEVTAKANTNAADIGTLKIAINGNGADNVGLVTKVSNLENTASTLNGTVNSHSALLAGLDGTQTVAALIADAKKAGTDAATAVATLEAGLVTTNKNDIATLKGNVTDLQNADTALGNRIASLEGQIGGLTGAMHFVGVSTVDPSVGTPVVEGVEAFAKGDVVLFDTKEYVYDGTAWLLLGDEGSYAVKATTLAGYGITDAYTKNETYSKNEVDSFLTWSDMA